MDLLTLLINSAFKTVGKRLKHSRIFVRCFVLDSKKNRVCEYVRLGDLVNGLTFLRFLKDQSWQKSVKVFFSNWYRDSCELFVYLFGYKVKFALIIF